MLSFRLTCVISILLCLWSCSSNNVLPNATIHPSYTTDIDDYKYLIGPGDSVNIFVWRNPELSGSFSVRPDGMITTKLIEDIEVTGRTPTQLARELEEQLSVYINNPRVSVTIGGYVGPFSEQVRVIGEATNPRAVNYKENMTLLDLMISVGGITEFADGNNTQLIRIENGEQKVYRVFIDDLIRDGDISKNVDMLPGDILIVPEAWF
ncbi:sugar ABC transporter substrate-binding protein [Alteromonas portus]|uniref:Sugar ABC transporter substrate-binding protein n=2 Tax=Alteromonas portus TaxID=2565549 RepID=A0A4U0ZCS2_9ALTE|nr:XrtA/PEP-CTERM system exopolysaccharide export protein [Alteromonas portus]TKB03609.1 sugar ABC transporter substrate-binding protein [Alteromonas portus]